MAKKSTNEVEFDPSQVKIARQLVYPTLKTEPGKTVYVKILSAMEEGRRIESDEKNPNGATRGPATILKVKVLHAGEGHALNGEDAQIVCNKLLVGILNETYPNGGYVGKSFQITKAMEKKKGKGTGDGYFTFQVNEIE